MGREIPKPKSVKSAHLVAAWWSPESRRWPPDFNRGRAVIGLTYLAGAGTVSESRCANNEEEWGVKMGLSLDVKPELQDRVREEAQRLNLDPAVLLSEAIEVGLANLAPERAYQKGVSAHVAGYQDALTSLPNHWTFQMQLRRQWEESSKNGAALTLLLMDIDNFKRINDDLGHITGDQLLKEIAGVLVHQTRAQDFVARLGGDEFAILLPDTDAAGATPLVKALHGVLRDFFSDKSQPVTVSIGLAEAPPFNGSANDLLKRADQEVLREKSEKRGGRNRTSIYLEQTKQSKVQKERARKNARLIALLDSFEEGDADQQRQDLKALQEGLEEARPGQRRLFGEGVNP